MEKENYITFKINRAKESRLDDAKAIIRQAKSLAVTLQAIAEKEEFALIEGDKEGVTLDVADSYRSSIESAASWISQYYASAKKASDLIEILSPLAK